MRLAKDKHGSTRQQRRNYLYQGRWPWKRGPEENTSEGPGPKQSNRALLGLGCGGYDLRVMPTAILGVWAV
jgi:hypothetical protein